MKKIHSGFLVASCLFIFNLSQAQNSTIDEEERSLLSSIGRIKTVIMSTDAFKRVDTIPTQVAGERTMLYSCSDSLRIYITTDEKGTTVSCFVRDEKLYKSTHYYWNCLSMASDLKSPYTLPEKTLGWLLEKSKIVYERKELMEELPSYTRSDSPEFIFEGTLQNGALNGTAKYFFWEYGSKSSENAQKATGIYKDNKRDGLWKSYFRDEFYDREDYKGFLFHKKNNVANNIQFQGNYAKGIKIGNWIEITRIKTRTYEDFMVEFLGAYFDITTMQVIHTGMYDLHEKTGLWKVQDENNRVIAQGSFSHDKKTGEWTYYSLVTQKPALLVAFKNDLISDTLQAIEEGIKREEISKDKQWDNVSLNVFPIFIQGKHFIKFHNTDQSSVIQNLEFINTKEGITVRQTGEEIKKDAYGRLIMEATDSLAKVKKEARIIIPKIHTKEVFETVYSPNMRYMAKMTVGHIEVWDLENFALLSSFDHKIETRYPHLGELSNDGRTVTAANEVVEKFHYLIDFPSKTVKRIESEISDGFSGYVSVVQKTDKDFDPSFITLCLGYYSEKGMNKLFKIPIQSIAHIKEIDMKRFEMTPDERFVSFFNKKDIFVFDLRNKRIMMNAPKPVDFTPYYDMIDSSRIIYNNADYIVVFNVRDSTLKAVGEDVVALEFAELDLVNQMLYAVTFNTALDYQRKGMRLNLASAAIEFYNMKEFMKIVPEEIRRRNGIKSTYFRPGLAGNALGELEKDHPVQPYWKKTPYDVYLKDNRFDFSFFCLANDLKDWIHYNQAKRTLLHKPVYCNVFSDQNYILYTPDQYYCGSRNIGSIVKFEMEMKLYAFEQFDLKYNRPDIILDRLGYADSLTIATYHHAYLKRLKRMGFTLDMLKDDFHLPVLVVKNKKQILSSTDSVNLELNLEINDTKYRLDRINVFINNVPVYGSAGIDLRKHDSQTISHDLKLLLCNGENKIQVSVLNQAGAESYKETIYITYKSRVVKKPDLYLITIGDSKYKDARFDLTYAAKDAEDIKKAFEGNDAYDKVFTLIYTNENVTLENVRKLKATLKRAKIDDVVVITVAGHGVLDKNLDYYLATYDMDFNNPVEKGLAYEELESLVDGIAPLRKVIFLDACHSGEVDKDEVEQLAVNTESNSGVKFRTAGAGIQKKNLGLKTTGELMSELFTDLRRGTGATIISSSGGAEYAMESDQWKNGLFTYCFLHGLKDKVADVNGDGQIMLSELQNYLRTEVTSLSKGAQQPTSRIENLSMDFRIW